MHWHITLAKTPTRAGGLSRALEDNRTILHTVLLPWPPLNSPEVSFSSLADESMSLGELVARSNVTTVSYIPARVYAVPATDSRVADTLPRAAAKGSQRRENDRSE